MEIIIAKNSGLCYGVKRALRLAYETRNKKSGTVFTLGDLIHNPQVIDDLKKKNILPVSSLEEIHDGPIIIRSHGVSPETYKHLEKKNFEIIDATCPIVKKIQQLVESLAEAGEAIIIVGNRQHPETTGLIGYSKGKGTVIENELQAKSLPRKKKRAVLAQSTQDLDLFKRVVAVLVERTEEIKVFNTICKSTQTRQKSTSELASCVDVLFIIGGKNSSNTYKLFEISKRVLSNTYFIENADQITPEMLKNAEKIGLSGGASTPPEAIQKAMQKIKTHFKQSMPRENSVQCQSQ